MRYLPDFWPCPFSQIFCTCNSRVFLTVKHRQHRIKLVRNSMYCFFSYANKFGEFIMATQGHKTQYTVHYDWFAVRNLTLSENRMLKHQTPFLVLKKHRCRTFHHLGQRNCFEVKHCLIFFNNPKSLAVSLTLTMKILLYLFLE